MTINDKKICGKILKCSGINLLSKKLNSGRTKIVLYHGVVKGKEAMPEQDFADLCIEKAVFEKHIVSLKENFNIISLDDFFSMGESPKSNKNYAIITFDDGYLNNFTEAYPVLRKHDVKAAFFISSGFIGSKELLWFNKIEEVVYGTRKDINAVNSMKRKIKNLPYPEFQDAIKELEGQSGGIGAVPENYCFNPMNWENVKELAKDPNITIGSHGKTHYPFSNLPESVLWEELRESKSFIENKINKKVDYLSYPHGLYNDNVIKIAKACKYKAALTVTHGFNDNKTDPFLLRRNEIGNSGDMEIFSGITSGGWDFGKNFFRLR